MRDFRYDFKHALIEEYKTYWDAFQDPNDPYCQLLTMDPLINDHFRNRKMQAKGFHGTTETRLLDQNTFWFITYAKSLKALSCINDIHQDEIDIICRKNRWEHHRKIIRLSDEHKTVDPLSV